MAKGGDVLAMLIPQGGWVITESDYDSIQWLECEPITKAEFDAGMGNYDAWKAKQEAKVADDKAAAQAKLAALGLTTDDLKALGL